MCNATTGKCTCAVGEGVTGERCTECSINSGHYVIENHTCNGKVVWYYWRHHDMVL